MGPNKGNILPKQSKKCRCMYSNNILRLGKIRYKIVLSHIQIDVKVNNDPDNPERKKESKVGEYGCNAN